MPSLRYGRDITDDAAFLVGQRDEALKALQRRRMSAANRAAAQERLALIEDRIRSAYGRNGINRAETLAQYATPFEGTYTSEGRNAAGLQGTVQTRPALPKSVNDIVRRMQKRGLVPEARKYDENDSNSPVSIRAPRVQAAGTTPRLTAARAAQRAQGETNVRREAAGPVKRGKPVKAVATAKTVRQAQSATRSRAADNAKRPNR